MLSFLFSIVPNWPVVLISIGVISRLAMAPLLKFTLDQQKRLAKAKPELEAIPRKDVERFLRESRKVKNAHGIREGWLLLSTFAQLPILIWLYRAIQSHTELAPATLAWLPSLAAPDPLFILPITAALITYAFARSQKANPWLQSGLTLAFSVALPSAVVVYQIAAQLTQVALQSSFQRTI